MRGEQEKICFERVKEQAIKKADTQLLSYWNIVNANSDYNAFPDFTFADGFIEHFQVSAANETRKGSAHNIAVNEFEQDYKEFLQSHSLKNESLDTRDMQIITHKMGSPNYSYKNFVNSFKRNFDKHKESLQKYNGEKAVGIFLIELVGSRITIMQNGQFKDFYRLGVDKELLEYIEKYSEYLRYIVFANSENYEFIDVQSIPALLQNIPTNLTFGVGRYMNTKLNLFIDL